MGLALYLLLGGQIAPAQTATIPWYRVASGGGTSAGNGCVLIGTIGQAEPGFLQGGGAGMYEGFWSADGPTPPQTIVWIKPGSGNWSNPANWSPSQVPGPQDYAAINQGSGYTVTVDTDAACGRLTLTAGGVTLAGPGKLTVAGLLIWTRGTISGAVWCNGGSVSGSADVGLGGGKLINSGTLDMSGLSGWFRTQGGGVISNLVGARFILPANSAIHQSDYQPATIYNDGWMGMCPGAGTVECHAAVVSAGTFEVGSGTLQLEVDSTIGGTCTVSKNATLNVQGGTVNFNTAINWAGTFAMDGGAANLNSPTPMTFGGLSIHGGTANFNSAVASIGGITLSDGTANFNGPGSIAVGSLTMNGGTLGGSDLLVLAAPLTWTRGTLSGAVWCNGGTVSGGTGVSLLGGKLINSGTLDMSGLTYRFWTQFGGAISNLAGARFILPPGPGIILNGYQPATIYNYGWMGMCPGAGTVMCQAPVVNAGTLQVGSGTLDLTQPYIQNAGLTCLWEGRLQVDQGFALNGGTLAGTNTLLGSLTSSGVVDPGATPGAPGLLTISGNYVQTGGGTLQVDLGGVSSGSGFDCLAVGGTASLAGTLNASLVNAFTPPAHTNYTFLTSGGLCSGMFNSVTCVALLQGGSVTYAANSATLTVVVGPLPSVLLWSRLGDDTISLSWPVSVGVEGFTLQWTPSLSPPISWTPVPTSLLETNGDTVTYDEAPSPTGNKFFQLRHP